MPGRTRVLLSTAHVGLALVLGACESALAPNAVPAGVSVTGHPIGRFLSVFVQNPERQLSVWFDRAVKDLAIEKGSDALFDEDLNPFRRHHDFIARVFGLNAELQGAPTSRPVVP